MRTKKRSCRRFLKVVIGIIILALLLVLFGKVGVFMLVNVFHVINYVVVLYMNYPQCGDCMCIISQFCKGES